jgi:hypothetical protein
VRRNETTGTKKNLGHSQTRTVDREIVVAVRRRNGEGDAGDAEKLGKISGHKESGSLADGSSCYERQLDMDIARQFVGSVAGRFERERAKNVRKTRLYGSLESVWKAGILAHQHLSQIPGP